MATSKRTSTKRAVKGAVVKTPKASEDIVYKKLFRDDLNKAYQSIADAYGAFISAQKRGDYQMMLLVASGLGGLLKRTVHVNSMVSMRMAEELRKLASRSNSGNATGKTPRY